MMKNDRGFSLVEAVVAMAVILIISASVLAMMLSGARAQKSEIEHHRANARLADIITVYRISNDETAFKQNLAFALGIEGELSLERVPLSEGYTAAIVYGTGGITVSVTDAKGRPHKGMGYTFPEPLEVTP
jgi:prepilin-type N-terminal cleavage/methylation domain-containing protein